MHYFVYGSLCFSLCSSVCAGWLFVCSFGTNLSAVRAFSAERPHWLIRFWLTQLSIPGALNNPGFKMERSGRWGRQWRITITIHNKKNKWNVSSYYMHMLFLIFVFSLKHEKKCSWKFSFIKTFSNFFFTLWENFFSEKEKIIKITQVREDFPQTYIFIWTWIQQRDQQRTTLVLIWRESQQTSLHSFIEVNLF